MTRYRPPQPKSSPYITPAGFQRLREELDGLWVRRRDAVVHLSAAAAEGDRSENAEYIYRKKQIRELDRRIRYLQKRLPALSVVTQRPAVHDKVFFGASVQLIDDADAKRCFRIVGADEIDPDRGWISVDAPLSRALLGRKVDDEITAMTPAGQVTYWIESVHYQGE